MTKNKHLFDIAKFVFIDVIGNIFYFPIWWYSKGLLRVILWYKNGITDFANYLAIPILFKSLFKPLFGMNDIVSRIISIVLRFVYFFVLMIVMVIYLILLTVFVLAYMLLPLFIAYNIIYQFEIIDYHFLDGRF